jgi:hypothetical protein
MEKIINFSPEGVVTSLHQDAFPLGFLGPQKIARATDIRFNEEFQEWDIYVVPEGDATEMWTVPPLRGFAGYDEARRFEVKWINRCMSFGMDWRGGDVLSIELADALRPVHDYLL